MATLNKGQTFGATETVTNTKLHALVDSATISGIVNADCDAAMNLANSKIASITDAGKVSGSSVYNLASIPSGSGAIPAEHHISAFPIGSIYINVDGTNPGTFLGGTWEAFGAGKTLVGLDSSDTDFDTAEETGGAKTHTLTEAELPAHTHSYVKTLDTGNPGGPGGSGNSINSDNTGSTGSGSAHNNLQPYIVVYFWKRTA